MGKLSLKDKVCLLTSWALVLMFGAAEHDYFPQADSFTWEEARNHCQVCFEDLVTLTSENTRTIAVNLTSDYWVGLRKNLNLTSNSTMFWSRWANGDPLAFQNWYPGWPVLKAPSPEPVCCSCSCTCPTRTTSPTYSSTLSGAMTTFSRPTESTDFSVSSSGTDEGTQESTSSAGQTATGPTVTDQTAAGQTASDQTAAGQTASDQTAAGQTASDQTAAGQTAAGQTASDQTVTGPTVAGQTASDQTVTGPTVAGQTASDQTVTGPTVAGQTAAGQTAAGQTASDQTAAGQTASDQTAAGQTAADQTAAGQTASDQTATGPTVTGPTVTGPTVTGPTAAGPTAAGPTVAGQTATGPTATGPTATGPTATGPTASDPTATGPTATGPTVTGPTATGPTATGPTASDPTATGPTATGPTVTGPTATGPTASDQTATGPTATGPTATGPTVTGPTATGPTATGPTATGPTATGPTVAGQTAAGPTVTGPTVAGQTVAGQTASDQTAAGQTAAGQTASDQTAAGQTASDQTATGPTVTGPTATGQTVAGQTASDQTAAGQTAAGQTASDQMATGPTVTRPTPTGPTATGPTVTRPTSTGPTATRPTAPGPLVAECVRSPMLSPMLSSILSPNISNVSNASNASNVSNTDQNYIEDSCVVMLSFGAWVERNCLERLPFICYEVRFIGKVNASNVTTQSAILSWERGPGSIRHYRLEVTGDREERQENQTDLTATLGNLTAGTRYSVKVFPVKCQRDLNPQTVVFYTIPNKVDNLRADDQTESSVTLSWDKPSGGVDFYVVKFNDRLKNVRANRTVVKELTPGSTYTFSIVSAVDSETTRSEESNITVFTRPGKVSKLTVSENSDTSLKLSWKPPSGQFKDFRVTAMNVINIVLFNETTTQKEAKVTNLPVGSNITLSVTARASHGLEGDSVSTVGHTTPGPVSNLTLVPESDYINATWNFPAGTVPTFKITLQLDGEVVQTHKQQESEKTFTGLKNAANYTVTVRITSGELESPAVSKSTYTKPASPRNLRVAFSNQSQITLKWDAPDNAAAGVNYSVKLSSGFWGHYFSVNEDHLNHTFDELKSGTRYEAEVQTVVGNTSSSAITLSPCTDAKKIEISLAMLCSSKEALLCDKATTRDRVFEQLQKHFHNKLQNFVLWELKKPN